MRRVLAAIFVLTSGCGLISGLDNLEVDDGGVDAVSEPAPEDVFVEDVVTPDADAGNPGDATSADGGVDVTPVPGVKCGGKNCFAPSPYCCRNGPSATCVAANGACLGVEIRCDSPADCPQGQVCCGTGAMQLEAGCLVATSVSCATTCSLPSNFIMCDDASECTGNQTCSISTCTIAGYDICH